MWRPSSSSGPPREFEEALYEDDEADDEGVNERLDDMSEGSADSSIEDDDGGPEMEVNLREFETNETHHWSRSPSRSRSPLTREESSPRAPSYSPLSRRGSSPMAGIEMEMPPYSPPSRHETPSPIIVIEVPADVAEVDEDGAYSPDAHPLYVPPAESAQQNSPTRAARGGRRSVRGGRARGGRARGRGRVGLRQSHRDRGGRTASLVAHAWTIGDPIVHVCTTDEDVPVPLRTMVENLVRDRQQRDSILAARTARREVRQRQLHLEDEEGEDFHDAEDNDDAVLLGGRNSFEWQPMESFTPNKEVFTPERTGSVEHYASMYDAFRSFWPESILQDIVQETNRYASEIESPVFQREWYDTNIHELLILFAFWMMLGIIKMPTIKSCFSTNALLSTAVFRQMFSYRRYLNLSRALHFANNSVRPPNASRLYCFGPILDSLNNSFRNNYIPGPNVSIDESLTLWKGILQFRQYIRTKAARFGIKTFELCDSTTGYLWSFIVYTGKDLAVRNSQSVLLKSTSVVLDLIQPLLHKGYCLFMDNWFNSPTLARYLKRKSTDCVGTLRASRCGVPALVQQANLKRGQLISRHCGDVVIQGWQDKKKILTISTYHDASCESVSNGRVTQYKPKVVLDYNKYMGGVDRKDQMLEPYLIERKRCKKWYLKFFKRLLNASILNSRILLESSTATRVDHLACRLHLVQAIIEQHLHLAPIRNRYSPHAVETLARIDTRHVHWPVRVTQSAAVSDAGRHTRSRCVHCMANGRKNIRTSFKCEFCNKALCIDDCFKLYHNV